MTMELTPPEDWTRANYQLPKEVDEYTGPGRLAVRDVSRMMLHHVWLLRSMGSGKMGLSLAEVMMDLRDRLGHRRNTIGRAWSALINMGYIASVYAEPTGTQFRTGEFAWDGPMGKLFPGEPNRHYEREAESRRTQRERENREDSQTRSTPWAAILRAEGWTETGRSGPCGCPIWSAPGIGATPELATSHAPTCGVFYFEAGDEPLYVHTDNAPGAVGLTTHAYSSRTITKTQAVIYGQGLVKDFLRTRGKDVESEAERRFWETYTDLRPLALNGLVPQHKVPPYRLDFAIPNKKIGIEIDGYGFHSDKDTFLRDRQRQRALEMVGWRIIRFAGKEACDTPERCVTDAAKLVTVFQGAN